MKLTDNLCNLRSLVWIFVITLVMKCLMAHLLPLTGDEAYFAVWGHFFDWGYYDHTPLIGWILYPLVRWSHANIVLRLPAIIATSAIGWLIYLWVKKENPQKAALLSVLFFVSPLNLFGVFVTTDVPLILFSFLSVMFLYQAVRHQDSIVDYLLSGVFLGLAFFSKYFAVLLALGYVFYWLFSTLYLMLHSHKIGGAHLGCHARPSLKRHLGFCLLFLCVIPFGLVHLYWNYTHDWANILFNIYNRNAGITFEWRTVGLYVLSMVYLLTPPIFYYLLKHRKVWWRPKNQAMIPVVFSILVPCLFFLLLSTVKSIGLHWPMSFALLIYPLLATFLTHVEIRRCIFWTILWSALHGLLLLVILLTPLSFYQKHLNDHRYAESVFILKHPDVRQALEPYAQKGFIISSPSYAKAVLMFIDSGVYSPMFGEGSYHGRQDDLIVDFKNYNHKNFAILFTKRPRLVDVTVYFKTAKTVPLNVHHAQYYVVLGENFQYKIYRQSVLEKIYQHYWKVPETIPHKGNFYKEKYGF